MPDAPRITITDPNDPLAPGDLLEAGPEREPVRVPRRAVAGAVALALLIGGVVLAVQHVQDQHRRDRLARAAFAKADRVDYRLSSYGLDPGDRSLTFTVSSEGVFPGLTIDSLTVTGKGLARPGVARIGAPATASSVGVTVPASTAVPRSRAPSPPGSSCSCGSRRTPTASTC